MSYSLCSERLPAFLSIKHKGYFMEGHVDVLNVAAEQNELVALYYRMELAYFLESLMITALYDKSSV